VNEAVTWSFLPEGEAAALAAMWTLANPIEDLKAMRPSLLPGLLSAPGATSIAGRHACACSRSAAAICAMAGATKLMLLAGEREPRGWKTGKAQAFDAFDAKAEALALLAEAGAPVDNLQVMGEAGAVPSGPVGHAAPWAEDGAGALRHAASRDAKAFARRAGGRGGIFLDRIPAKAAPGFARPHYAPPALQAVTRDFAFLVDAGVPAGDLVRAVKGPTRPTSSPRGCSTISGAGRARRAKSLAVEVTLQPGEKSYDDAALKAIADKVVAAAGKLGGVLRG
jgi:phenylalanyl-tRNA synthetase beta chain